jgi:hypothetical protein
MLVASLSRLRGDCGFPFIVTSGSRCDGHNGKVSTVGNNSPHKVLSDGFTHAADISIKNSSQRGTFLKHAYKYFKRVGVGKDFIHVDNADRLESGIHVPGVTWTY